MKAFLGEAAILATWALVALSGRVSHSILAPPWTVLERAGGLFPASRWWFDFGATGQRWFLGLLIGLAGGIPIGLLMGCSRNVEQMLHFPADFLRSLPATALFPLFLLVFGIEDASKIAMIAWSVGF